MVSDMFARRECVKAPIRLLGKARDMYVNSLTDCSGKMSYGGAMGPTHLVPRSFSTSSSRSGDYDEDMRELVRAASQRGLMEKLELDIQQSQKASKKLPRSFTVGFGRIDEDKPYDFPLENPKVAKKPDMKYPRSKSAAVAVSKRPNLYA